MVGTDIKATGQAGSSENLERLKALLAEMFMFDQADLDFGIYRIMNLRREEIRRFLDQDLLPQVREALGNVAAGERAAIERELREAEADARRLGMEPDAAPRVRELRAKYEAEPDIAATEEDVYSHLVTFFRRYYKDGDFISLRRYKEGVYAIPYEGEEVKLHWANADQYYVKSAEHFRDYTFLLPDGRRVHFKLVGASTETNNNRPQNGNDRRFLLVEEEPVIEQEGELVIRFEYRPDAGGRKRDAINADSVARILEQPVAAGWRTALARDMRPDEAKEPLSLLAKHLNTYTAKNEFDYFIHKDLGGFLRRELDFYLKAEVMHLDDIDQDGKSATDVGQYLDRLRAIRRVGHKVIEFLAQLEDFQKRLWLKKKFVVETHWCATLDRVPEELYEEIAANERQREEWVRLFAIDEITGDMVTPGYSEPLSVEFLRANPYLVVDTSLFDRAFTDRLLASVEDLDASTDGLLVHGDNFQALSVMEPRYRAQIRCVYIDPPYNTGNDQFVYKDRYQHSSWLAMMENRLRLATRWMRDDAALFISIDGHECDRLKNLGDLVLGGERYLNTFVWINNLKGRQISGRGAAGTHEYVLAYGAEDVGVLAAPVARFKDVMPSTYKGFDYEIRYDKRGCYVVKNELHNTNSRFNEETRPTLVFNIYHNRGTGEIRFSDADHEGDGEGFTKIVPKRNNDGIHRYHAWRWNKEKILKDKHDLEFVYSDNGVRIYTKVRDFQWTTLKDVITDIGTASGAAELRDLVGAVPFVDYPKPVSLVQVFAGQAGSGDLILDYFAGSGTTAHAVIDLNREDGGQRKYILVEMGEYFDTVMKPRVLKAVYSKDWKDGRPVSREGISQLIKIIRLESYEDTLNNLEVRRTEQQQSLLDARDGLREEYMLRYWLDVETRGSASLLDTGRFDDPWAYRLRVALGSAAETRPVTVDLVETFNYLIGLHVRRVDVVRGVTMVQGTLPSGEKALVIWRKVADMPSEELDRFLWSQRINPRDMQFDVIYANGDNHLENTRRSDETWKVRLIEEEFLRLMFETADRA